MHEQRFCNCQEHVLWTMLKGFHCLNCSFCWYKYCIRSSKSNRTKTKNFILKGVVMQLSSDGWRRNPLGNWVILISSGQKPCTMQSNSKHCILFYIFQMLLKGFKAWVKIKMCSEHMNNWQYLSPGCLRADVSYFLCCTRKRDVVPFTRATKEIGDVCTQAIARRSRIKCTFPQK